MVLETMAFLSTSNEGINNNNHSLSRFRLKRSSPSPPLHILCFEAAKIMARLIGLYKFLSDKEFNNLRNGILKSSGINYLNSSNESFLLHLACSEKLEELEAVATNVANLGRRCSQFVLKHFNATFTKLESGVIGKEIPDYNSKRSLKIVEKMEKYVSTTAILHEAIQELEKMEASERKSLQWGKSKASCLEDKLLIQRKRVNRYKEISLWNKSFDKGVGLMAQTISVIFVRICYLFGPFVSGLPRLSKPSTVRGPSTKPRDMKIYPERDYCLLADRHKYLKSRHLKSAPARKVMQKPNIVRFQSQMLASNKFEKTRNLARTVGDAGLAYCYANIIILAERYLNLPLNMNDETRGQIYGMLTTSLRSNVRRKLLRFRRREKDVEDEEAMAEGWREAVDEMLEWLAPMAHDTVLWQTERNLEKQFEMRVPSVLLLQTLHFADLDKTEDVIVEVLFGLCSVFKYENRLLR